MTITTKFNPRDKVLTIVNGKIEEGVVYWVNCEATESITKVKYMIQLPHKIWDGHANSDFVFPDADKVFGTKAELLASL